MNQSEVNSMHEESLIRSLLRQVEDLALQHHSVEIEDIEVETGPLSGFDPLLLHSAFERLCELTPCQNASLTIRNVSLQVMCRDCELESELENFRFVCPECGSASLKILSGDTVRLLSVRMQINDSVSSCGMSQQK